MALKVMAGSWTVLYDALIENWRWCGESSVQVDDDFKNSLIENY